MFRTQIISTALAAVISLSGAAGMATAEGADIVMVGGKLEDQFWSVVKRGVDDAAMVVESQGGSVTYLAPRNYENLGADAADLVRTGISRSPDAILVANWVPEAENDAIKDAIAAGISVVIYNAGGMQAALDTGAMTYIGSDEYVAGVAGGEYFATHGVMNVLGVNTLPGATNTEARCQGVADGMAKHGGTSKQLPMPGSSFGNPTAVAQGVKSALLKASDIEGVVTISVGDATSSANGIMQAGLSDRVKLGSFDMDGPGLDRIKDGTQLFAIDQQPYLQGFLSVMLANSYVNYGLDLPTKPILTGPGIVDASNIDATLAGVQAGTR